MKKLSTRKSPEIDYQLELGEFSDVAGRLESSNQKLIDEQFSEDIAWLVEGTNLLYRIASYYVWLADAPHIASLNQANNVLFSACHKNLVAFHSALKLTRVGLYGPARAILRHVLESLVIAKFSSVSHNPQVMERWKEGEVVYFGNAILKKILRPDPEPFRDFWNLMSDYSHATIYSQQIVLNVQNDPEQVPLNLVFMRILMDCQYHALVSHFITPSMHYVAKRYAKAGTDVPPLKSRMNTILQESRATLLPWPRQIIRCYRSTWTLQA
ncbi:MAG: hypothetical protein KF892_23490 [Rhizobacter sp.]|nr:hypothetical protein [Rhizobacter sp.]